MRRSLTIALTLGLALQAVPVAAVAQDAPGDEPLIAPAADDIVGWTDFTENGSTIRWKIDAEGALIVEPLSGTTGVLDYSPSSAGDPARPPWYPQASSITSFGVSDGCTIECRGPLSRMFMDCGSLTSVDLSSLDTSHVEEMDNMFDSCASLTSLDLSSLDTSQVKSMDSMFFRCFALTSLDLSSFDTSHVENMRGMFNWCKALASVDVSSFDTSRVTDMSWMFDLCESLASLDVSSFDTSQVTDMTSMFSDCHSLASLDVSSFDTSQVTDMSSMFAGCRSLTSLDLSSFNTSRVEDMLQMFYGCRSLTSLDLSTFDMSQVGRVKNMFLADNLLREVKLGKEFVFTAGESSAVLPTPQGDGYTGKWVRVTSAGSYLEPAYTPDELRDNWNSELAGTWVWEQEDAPVPEPVAISYAGGKEGATGSMAGATVADGEDYAIPEPGFALDGYTVSGWKASGIDADGNAIEERDFALGATIAAGTFPAGSKVTLTAVWTEVPKPEPQPQPTPRPAPTPTKPTTTTKTTTAKPATTTAKKASTPARSTAPVLPKTGDPSVVASGLATGGLAALAAGLHRRRKRS